MHLLSVLKKLLKDRTFQIITCASIGLALGVGLSMVNISEEVSSWIKLPGEIFLRSLKCTVILMVFTCMIISIVDMEKAGKAFSVGGRTIGMYALTTACASIQGLIMVLIFKNWYSKTKEEEKDTRALFNIYCGTNNKSILQVKNEMLYCVKSDIADDESTLYLLNDVNSIFQKGNGSTIKNDISVSQTFQEGVFKKIFIENLIETLLSANFMGVICFSIFFGCALVSLLRKSKHTSKTDVITDLLAAVYDTLVIMINWIVNLSPLAVISLISGALSKEKDLTKVFKDMGLLMVTCFLGFSSHLLVFMPTLFYLITKKNPFRYMKNMIPAQFFAFASASSAATIPINLECTLKSDFVDKTIATFVLSLGASINLDGLALYFPATTLYLAISQGIQVTPIQYIMTFLLSTVGSVGAAPIPASVLILIITSFNTIFGTSGTPQNFGLIVAVDWILDRMSTTVNISGDNFMVGMICAMEAKRRRRAEEEDPEINMDEKSKEASQPFSNEGDQIEKKTEVPNEFQ
jgi:solute carrier family 1 (neutral amino acid transporter) protein 5